MSQYGFLFDNDGVLIDSSDLHWESWVRLMQEEPTFQMTHTQFIQGFGKRNDLILKELLPHSTPQERTQLADRKEELFRECARGNITLLPGMESFLQTLKTANIPRIIASSTPIANLELYLTSTVLGDYFDAFVSAEEVAQGKPSPDIFIEAATRLHFKPEQCIVLEDAPAGIESAKGAGCFIVALATTHEASSLKDYHLIYPDPTALDLQEILHHFSLFKKR